MAMEQEFRAENDETPVLKGLRPLGWQLIACCPVHQQALQLATICPFQVHALPCTEWHV